MAEKIVVCCRMPPEGIRGALSATYLARARALAQRAEALGATLAAWSALSLAFAFDPDGLEEAIDLAVSLAAGTSDPASAWASGIAQGELEALAETGLRADLAWGVPLVQALALSRMAKVGEVLLHGSLVAASDGSLHTMGSEGDEDPSHEARGVRLDCANPWMRPRAAGAAKKPPPLPARARSSASMRAAPVAPAAPSPLPAPAPTPVLSPPAPPARDARSTGPIPAPAVLAQSARTTGPIPPPVVVQAPPRPPPPPRPDADAEPASVKPRTFSSIPPHRYPTLSTFDAEEVDPEGLAARMMQLSRDALLVGDAQALERWSDGLKATGEKDSFADRMRAIARLSRGRVGDALRALEGARRSAEGAPAAKRCQASLALAVGLAFAGRADEALLEALDALARAREGGDTKAEAACLAFLAKLYLGVDRAEEAERIAGAVRQAP